MRTDGARKDRLQDVLQSLRNSDSFVIQMHYYYNYYVYYQWCLLLIRRSARCGFVLADLLVVEELCRLADETLYRSGLSPVLPTKYIIVTSGTIYRITKQLSRALFHNLHIPASVNYISL